MKYNKVKLDERAQAYVLDKLQDGKEISKGIRKRILTCPAEMFAYLPPDISVDDRYNFTGGFKGFDYKVTREIIQKEIYAYLQSENTIVLFENSMFDKSRQLNAQYESKVMFRGADVYHFVASTIEDMKEIETIIDDYSNAWQNIFHFTSYPPEEKFINQDEMTDENLRYFIDHVSKVFIDAYDLDGYLIVEILK